MRATRILSACTALLAKRVGVGRHDSSHQGRMIADTRCWWIARGNALSRWRGTSRARYGSRGLPSNHRVGNRCVVVRECSPGVRTSGIARIILFTTRGSTSSYQMWTVSLVLAAARRALTDVPLRERGRCSATRS